MFNARLKQLREEAGYSQYSFATEFGVAQSTVGGWESGKREPNYDTLRKIAHFFNVSVGYLLGYVEEEPFPPEISKQICDDIIDAKINDPEKFDHYIIPYDIMRQIENRTYSFNFTTFPQYQDLVGKKLWDYSESKPTEPAPVCDDEDIKRALFGGDKDITDEQYEEVKRFAAFIKERGKNK